MSSTPLDVLVASRVRRRGPLAFDEVMDLALYHPEHGFYAKGGQAGRRGDFITSPEVGPLFGAVVARALDSWWSDLGKPDPYVVVEAGAGTGTLARTVLAAEPACRGTLRYVLVERSRALRERHGDHLQLTPPALAMGPVVVDSDGVEHPAETGAGPFVVSLGELPEVDGPVVTMANELLDNLAFRVLERQSRGWVEVRVGLADADDRLVEVTVADDAVDRVGRRLAPSAPVGGRIPVQDAAAGWVRKALDRCSGGGRVVVVDYAATTGTLASRDPAEWLRTYAAHGRGSSPLDALGTQDITADVCVDQLARARPLTSERTQAEFLGAHGIADLVADGRRVWAERAHLGDLAAIRSRSRVTEAEALLDPAGLGAFRVLEWVTPSEIGPITRAMAG